VYHAGHPDPEAAMTRTLFACTALFIAFAAPADVTIQSTATGKGFGISGDTTSTTYIKGLKMGPTRPRARSSCRRSSTWMRRR
jgi:hypothetical protein